MEATPEVLTRNNLLTQLSFEDQSHNTDLDKFPEELIHAIISKLSNDSREKCSLVCRKLRRMAYDKSLPSVGWFPPEYQFLSSYKNSSDPGFTKRLNFHEKEVFIHKSLMIGVYNKLLIKGDETPTRLLAFDMNTEKLVWGIKLHKGYNAWGLKKLPEGYNLNQIGELISLRFPEEKKVYFLHAETGKIYSTLELPSAADRFDNLHIDPSGFAYQVTHLYNDGILKGGMIVDRQWKPIFESKSPRGSFEALSTHCGFKDDFPDKLVLVGPTGDQVAIENCMSAQALENKLYTIESDLNENDKCLLTIRTLQLDSEVISKIEKSISIDAKKAILGKVCQNGQVVLFSEDLSRGKSKPIFVDLNSQRVTYIEHKFVASRATHHITDSGELWIWDNRSNEIWKVTPTHTSMMGTLQSGRGTELLHVDKNDQLYFVDRPY